MAEKIQLTINGLGTQVAEGTTVAAAIAQAGVVAFRQSVRGEMRAPLCGMGICYECRVTINDERYARSCQIVCRNGMVVQTNE